MPKFLFKQKNNRAGRHNDKNLEKKKNLKS